VTWRTQTLSTRQNDDFSLRLHPQNGRELNTGLTVNSYGMTSMQWQASTKPCCGAPSQKWKTVRRLRSVPLVSEWNTWDV